MIGLESAIILLIIGSVPAEILVEADQVAGSFDSMLVCSGDEIVQDLTHTGLDDMVELTGVPLLRMGGVTAEYYDWEGDNYNGLYYIDIGGIVFPYSLDNSLDNLLQFCEQISVVPILTVNYQINDPGKAARMVEYCNGDITTTMGSVRASRGHPEPYNVTYWCIGNEPDIAGGVLPIPPWGDLTFYRHFGIPFEEWAVNDSVYATAEDFAQLVSVYIDSMHPRSPIPLEIGGLSLSANLSWIEPVLSLNNEKMDWMDIHYYPMMSFSSDSTQYRDWLAAPTSGTIYNPPLEEWYPMVVDTVEKYCGGFDIPVWVMEYNILAFVEDPVWWNYLDGLFVADCMGHMSKCGIPIAALYSIAQGDPDEDEFPICGAIRTDTLSMRCSAWAMKLFRERFGSTVVEASCDQVCGGYGLEVYASLYEDWTLSLIAINKNLDSSYTTSIELSGYASDGTADVWQIVNDQPMNAPWNGTSGITYQGEIAGSSGTFSYEFPKASITCIWINPDPQGVSGQYPAQPDRYLEAAPNPSNGSVTFRYPLQESSEARIDIFNISGRLVQSLCSLPSSEGFHSVVWERRGSNGVILPAGVYLARLTLNTSGLTELVKLILI